MPDRTDVQWLKIGDEQLVLVRRALYDVYSLMTLEEFRKTEPYVEAVSVVTRHAVTDVTRRDGKNLEVYYPTDTKNPKPFFSIPKREMVVDE